MDQLIISFGGNESLSSKIEKITGIEQIKFNIRNFPDNETYLKIEDDVKGKSIAVICSLNNPDNKFLPLYFLFKTLKDLGAKRVGLVTPYLSYMRQDIRFQPGEAITSSYFASLISSFADWIITIDPHLHRHSNLEEIYTIPARVIHAAESISNWIKQHIANPVIIGPDSESEQWVSSIAKKAGVPYLVLEKERFGDKEVVIKVPDLTIYQDYTPVLVDDIVSTAKTMIKATEHLILAKTPPPVCVCVHPIFAGNAYQELLDAGASNIVSCNTISHPSNTIGIDHLLAKEMMEML